MKRAWITIVVLGIVLLAVPVRSRGDAGDRCEYPASRSFSAGHDEQGYFVHAAPLDPRGRGQAGQPITSVGDYLAAEAGATIVYIWPATVTDVGRGEWHAPDPLSALQAFAQAGGLFVVTPSPGWWLVGPAKSFSSPAAVTIAVESLGPAGQGWADSAAVGELERALVTQLPVRELSRFRKRGAGTVTLDYYWLAEEGPDTLLVLTSQPGDDVVWPHYQGFKVRAHRVGPKVEIKCIWAMNEHAVPSGRLVPEIAEDFDGDGYRDFVFDAGDDDHFQNTIVSGKTGRLLLSFDHANEIAVERRPSGLPRLAVDGIGDLQNGGESYPAGKPGESERQGPVVLMFDRVAGRFEPAPGSKATVTAQAIPQGPGDTRNIPRRTLAAALGGTDRVRAYLLMPGASNPAGGYEEVRAFRREYPQRVLFTCSPPTSTTTAPLRK